MAPAPAPVPTYLLLPERLGPSEIIAFRQPNITSTPHGQSVSNKGRPPILLPLKFYPAYDKILYNEDIRDIAQEARKVYNSMYPNAPLTRAEEDFIAQALSPCYDPSRTLSKWRTFTDSPSQRRVRLLQKAYKHHDAQVVAAQASLDQVTSAYNDSGAQEL